MTSSTPNPTDTSFLGRTEPCLLLEGQDIPFYDGCTKGLKSGLHPWQVVTQNGVVTLKPNVALDDLPSRGFYSWTNPDALDISWYRLPPEPATFKRWQVLTGGRTLPLRIGSIVQALQVLVLECDPQERLVKVMYVDEAGNYMASDLLKVPYLYAACMPGARALIFMTPKGLALVPDLVAEKMFIEIRPHEVILGLTKILRRFTWLYILCGALAVVGTFYVLELLLDILGYAGFPLVILVLSLSSIYVVRSIVKIAALVYFEMNTKFVSNQAKDWRTRAWLFFAQGYFNVGTLWALMLGITLWGVLVYYAFKHGQPELFDMYYEFWDNFTTVMSYLMDVGQKISVWAQVLWIDLKHWWLSFR